MSRRRSSGFGPRRRGRGMIGSVSAASRALEIAPDPSFGSPSQRHDDGWLGQVPPPAPPKDDPPAAVQDAVTGYESSRDAHDGGWLGQVPPPAPSTPATRPTAEDTATGYDSSRDAHDGGWLGQVPPPPPQAPPPPADEESPYAVPELAPEPWKSDPPLPGTDPTLFG